ncbi:MAG: trigger factor [Verrucomicrobia bacterium]|nr:MAG: trigger factor [Verrucomicrobiota bacterium]TAE87337.1 MAG: trigger factor [Verrucomicrobiota bacterium]TAF25192.1 MAG: trigger factor [Verrucomicrobiota bacterium]TAF40837.1 MAG: trigger factor [Verrucomicrobiota bacterium]
MNIIVEKQPNCLATLRVEVPSDTVSTVRAKIVTGYASQAKIAGFRPGKAPKSVIEKKFQGAIGEELEDRLVRQAFDEALRKEALKVLNFGLPQNLIHNSDGTVTFHAQLTLAPEVQLPNYKGITVKAPSTEVSDTEVDAQLEGLRERFADYADIEDRAAESGDLAVIDFSSSLDGQPLEEALGKPAGYLAGREGFWLKLDDSSFLPGFAAEIAGLKIDESKDIALTIPEDFPLADLRGREVVFHVTLKGLKQTVLPALDDEFAGKVTGGKTLEELRSLAKRQIEVEKRRRIDDHKVNQIVEHFNSLVEFELPEDLLRHETQGQADALVERGMKSGMSEDEINAQQAEIFATAGDQARTNLKTNFILQEIARIENIAVSDNELINHLAMIAQSRKQDPKKFIKELQRKGRLPGIRNSMLVGKAIDFVLEHATVEEIPEEPTTTDE